MGDTNPSSVPATSEQEGGRRDQPHGATRVLHERASSRARAGQQQRRRQQEARAGGDADGEQLEHAVRRDEGQQQRPIPLLTYSPITLPSEMPFATSSSSREQRRP